MTDTPARLLGLLSLLQTPREWPGGGRADRLGVSPRTIRRDVERLRDLGYPVEATPGVAGGYRLPPRAPLPPPAPAAAAGVLPPPPPLVLAEDEAVALPLGRQAAAQAAVAGMAESSVRALAKVVPVLPPR